MGENVKKKLEIIFAIIFSLAIVLTIIDLITINVTHKPMIILNNEGETYYGLLYNTYNCTEENKVYIKLIVGFALGIIIYKPISFKTIYFKMIYS